MTIDSLTTWRSSLNKLRSAKKCLLAIHIHPDNDAFQAAVAFGLLLKELAVDFDLTFDGFPPDGTDYSELPLQLSVVDQEGLDTTQYDTLVLLDTAVVKQLGALASVYENFHTDAIPIINIDHHAVNPGLGNFNLVDPSASATCEILFDLFNQSDIHISRQMANALLKGIYSDTDLLRTQTVTSKTLHAAAELIDLGADRMRMIEETGTLDVDRARLWAQVLAGLQRVEGAQHIVYAVADASLIGEQGEGEPQIEGLANYMCDLKGVELAVLFIQRSGGVKLSFRSRPHISALNYARRFGGGGHFTRAGCDFPGERMQDVVKRVIAGLA